MRIIGIGFAVLVAMMAASLAPADAQRQPPRPWCLLAGPDGPGGGLPDCSYHTLAQCMAAIGGGADGCIDNPALGWDRIEGKRVAPKRKARND